jgi:hypothetical protein
MLEREAAATVADPLGIAIQYGQQLQQRSSAAKLLRLRRADP